MKGQVCYQATLFIVKMTLAWWTASRLGSLSINYKWPQIPCVILVIKCPLRDLTVIRTGYYKSVYLINHSGPHFLQLNSSWGAKLWNCRPDVIMITYCISCPRIKLSNLVSNYFTHTYKGLIIRMKICSITLVFRELHKALLHTSLQKG